MSLILLNCLLKFAIDVDTELIYVVILLVVDVVVVTALILVLGFLGADVLHVVVGS